MPVLHTDMAAHTHTCVWLATPISAARHTLYAYKQHQRPHQILAGEDEGLLVGNTCTHVAQLGTRFVAFEQLLSTAA